MADQKTDDTKSPLARRGARPFAGPGSAPSTARPFLRPATPSQRPTAAPFMPPIAPTRPALGTTAIAAPAAPPQPQAQPESTPAVSAKPTPDSDPFFGNATPTTDIETPASRSRPITTEMIALDAFDAFDAVWGTSERHDTAEQPAAASPLDENSLGAAVDAPHPWAEDITAGGESVATSAPAPSEPAHPTPGFAMPAWLVDDHDSAPSVPQAMESAPSVSDWAAASSMIPAADDISPPDVIAEAPATSLGASSAPTSAPEIEPDSIEHAWARTVAAAAEPFATMPTPESVAAPAERPRFELVEDRSIEVPYVDVVPDARLVHRLRMSAPLDRLAQRVRDGEIDVSSIAPEATDAAVLASVLAALLGGSSSR